MMVFKPSKTTITRGANNTQQVRVNGKIVNNLPNMNKIQPPQQPQNLPRLPHLLPAVNENFPVNVSVSEADFTLEAKGEEAPALSVELKDGGRLYVAHPRYAKLATENPYEAVEKKLAFPSITTCVKQVDDPDGILQRWVARQVAGEASRMVEEVRYVWETKGAKAAKVLLTKMLEKDVDKRTLFEAKASNYNARFTHAAAERGTEVHAVIERLARGEMSSADIETLPARIVGYVRAYERFRAQFPNLSVAYTEVTVINEKVGYMGTADLIIKDDKGNYYSADYKTNKRGVAHEKTGMQLAAVAKATHIVTPEGERHLLPKIQGGLGIGLSYRGECSVTAFPVPSYYKRFMSATKLWYLNWDSKNPHTPKPAKVQSTNDISMFFN